MYSNESLFMTISNTTRRKHLGVFRAKKDRNSRGWSRWRITSVVSGSGGEEWASSRFSQGAVDTTKGLI